jgi:hypothetical protein
MNAVKGKQGLDLVLATDLLSDHAPSGPEQTAVFDLHPGGNIDPFQLAVPEAAGKFAAIHFIGLARAFLVFRRDIGRIYHHAFDAVLAELVVDPETGIASLVSGVIGRPGKVPLHVIAQNRRIRWLGERFMCAMFGHDADAPVLLMNIHTRINVLTGEIRFAKVTHGKSPFGNNFVGLTKLYLKPDLPL